MLKKGKKDEEPDVHELVRAGSLDQLKALLKKRGPKVLEMRETSLEQTPLQVACHEGQHDVAAWLLQQGASLGARDKHLWTCLHCAAARLDGIAQLRIMHLLVERGADLNAQNDDGATALHYLVRNSISDSQRPTFASLLAAMVSRGADLNARNLHGETPLHQAAQRGHRATMDALLSHGALVDPQTAHQETPLHFAVRQGHVEAARLLLSRGASPHTVSPLSGSPLQLAQKRQPLARLFEELLAPAAPPAPAAPVPATATASSGGHVHPPGGSESPSPVASSASSPRPASPPSVAGSSPPVPTDAGRPASPSNIAALRSKMQKTRSAERNLTPLQHVQAQAQQQQHRRQTSGDVAPASGAASRHPHLRDEADALFSDGRFLQAFVSTYRRLHEGELRRENSSGSLSWSGGATPPPDLAAAVSEVASAPPTADDEAILHELQARPHIRACAELVAALLQPYATRAAGNKARRPNPSPPPLAKGAAATAGDDSSDDDTPRAAGPVPAVSSGGTSGGSSVSSGSGRGNQPPLRRGGSAGGVGAPLARRTSNTALEHKGTRPREVGEFRLGELIGKGAYALVYRALSTVSGQVVAVKELPLAVSAADPAAAASARVRSELDLLQRLVHPNVVRLLSSVSTDSHLYVVMEYMEGGSLQKLLIRFGPLSERLGRVYMRQVATGLAFLHSHQVVHRDVKGANILLTKQGTCKLADFGIAHLQDAVLSHSRALAGTPNWMAPEVIEDQPVTPRADVWSLGCTLVELLTGGYPPYYGMDPVNAMYHICKDPSPPLPNGLSSAATAFLARCFHKDPTARASAADLLADEWLALDPAAAPPAESLDELLSQNHGSRLAAAARALEAERLRQAARADDSERLLLAHLAQTAPSPASYAHTLAFQSVAPVTAVASFTTSRDGSSEGAKRRVWVLHSHYLLCYCRKEDGQLPYHVLDLTTCSITSASEQRDVHKLIVQALQPAALAGTYVLKSSNERKIAEWYKLCTECARQHRPETRK